MTARSQIRQLRHVLGCLLGPVVRAWPDCVDRVRAVPDLEQRAEEFWAERSQLAPRPAELVRRLLGPPSRTELQLRRRHPLAVRDALASHTSKRTGLHPKRGRRQTARDAPAGRALKRVRP